MTTGPTGSEQDPALARRNLYHELLDSVDTHRVVLNALTLNAVNRMAVQLKTPTDRLDEFLFAMYGGHGSSSTEVEYLEATCRAFETQFGEDCLERVFGRLEYANAPGLNSPVQVHCIRPGLFSDFGERMANLEAKFAAPDVFSAVRYRTLINEGDVTGQVYVPTESVWIRDGVVGGPEQTEYLLYSTTRPFASLMQTSVSNLPGATLFEGALAVPANPGSCDPGDLGRRVAQIEAAKRMLIG